MTEPRWDHDRPLPAPREGRVTTLHRVEDAAAGALWRWAAGQPVGRASDAFGAIARRLGPRLGRVHARGRENMALALPELPEEAREAALLDEWENLGRTAAEYPHLQTLHERTEVVGQDRLRAVAQDGQAVFVSGHFANWELMAAVLHRAGIRTAVVYRAANNPLVDRRVLDFRAGAMSRVLIPKGKRGGRDLLKAMGDGLSPCLLTDQRLSDGTLADLLGRPALTAPAPARLALRAGLPVIPLQIVRRPGVRFTLTVHEPLATPRTDDAAADTQVLTQAINDQLSGFIRAHPGQWLWFHRRWKPRR